MDAPYYTVTVTSTTRGWTYTAVHGQNPDPEDPSVRSFLASPFSLSWSWADELVPNVLDPTLVRAGVWARTASELPAVDLGDIVTATLRIGLAGPVLATIDAARITEAETELVPGEPFPARLRLVAADMLVELARQVPVQPFEPNPASGSPGTYPPRSNVRDRWGMLAHVLGTSIGVPTSWGTPSYLDGEEWGAESAAGVVEKLIASSPGDGELYALVPYIGNSYPSGYEWAGAGGYKGYVDLNTSRRYLVVPTRRNVAGPQALPLLFAVIGGRLVLRNTPNTTGSPTFRPVSIDAGYCDLPAIARRSRDHIVNQVTLKGIFAQATSYAQSDWQYVATLAADVAARGVLSRDLETYLPIGDTFIPVYPGVAARAEAYLSDATTLAAGWAYDEFEVIAERMPQAMATAVLPYLAPSVPLDGRDGRQLREIGLHRVSPEAYLPDALQRGWVVAGSVVIENGTLRYYLTTVPGGHTYSSSATPITVGEFVGATYSLTTLANLDDRIPITDLDRTDNA